MDVKQLKRYAGLKHLSDFSDRELILSFALYENALIDLSGIRLVNSVGTPYESEILVSEDVAVLNHFVMDETPIMLPCPECKREQAFSVVGWTNPRIVPETEGEDDAPPRVTAVRPSNAPRRYNVFQVSEPTYRIGTDRLAYHTEKEIEKLKDENEYEKYVNKCVLECKAVLQGQLQELRREFLCSLNNNHRAFVEYRIFDPVSMIDSTERNAYEVSDDGDLKNAYAKMKNCLVIQKVGQYPSLADMQMFDIVKYQKVLDKGSYRDFTRALGLFADGIGCGSFVYLRRILEKLVEVEHQKCKSDSDWDDDAFCTLRFDDKLKTLEQFGCTIIPEPIAGVRTKIYGMLSKGVHESPEEECIELFPYMQFAIEEILDEQIRRKERAEKLKNFSRMLQRQ